MPHVSNKKINKKLSGKLFKKLLDILAGKRDRKVSSALISELLTPTEKIMLAKRLSLVLMLNDNIPQNKISEVLKMSPSTIARMSLKVEIGKYGTILDISKKEKIDVEKIIWDILTLVGYAPPMVGRRYWTKYRRRKSL